MKRKAVYPGVYIDPKGRFWARPWINGRRTNRLLRATKAKDAVVEANAEKFKSGSDLFAKLATAYVEAGCPDRHFNERNERFMREEKMRVEWLIKFFGRTPIDDIRPSRCPDYKRWRIQHIKKGTGERTVDLDLTALSNVLTYGVATNHIEVNTVKFNRPVFRRASMVRRSREVAPASGDEVHALARILMDDCRSAVLGWQLLFAAYTGCRTSELLRLRLDARTPDDPGFVAGGYLFLGRRSKRGVNPWVTITGDFKALMDVYSPWRASLGISSPFFFYNRTKDGVADAGSLSHAMKRASLALGVHHVTPHGLRSFYVTKRRGDGATDAQIAAEIGDSNPQMIPQSYGGLPASWNGGEKLTFTPVKGTVAWLSLDSLRTWSENEGDLDKCVSA